MKTRYFLTVFLTLTATVVIFSGCAVRRVPLGHFGEPSKAPVFLISENAESGGRFAKEADGFSEYFRKLFQAKLINAGFRVVNDPNEKHHLEVKMKLFYDSDLNYKNSFQYEGNAAVTLMRKGVTVEMLSIYFCTIKDKGIKGERWTHNSINENINSLVTSKAIAEFATKDPEAAPKLSGNVIPLRVRHEKVVAVFDIEESLGLFSADLIESLNSYLVTKLTEVSGYRVIPRERLQEKIKEGKMKSHSTRYDEKSRVELGRAVSARKSLVTKILKVDDNCLITATLYDIQMEVTERAVSVKRECTSSGLYQGVEEIAEMITRESAKGERDGE